MSLPASSSLARTERNLRPRCAWTLWIVGGLCLLSALTGRLGYLAKPFEPDADILIYLGKLTSEGGRFCHDLTDNKFPSVGLMTSLCWRGFGAHWLGYVLLQTGLSLGGGGAVGLLRLAGDWGICRQTHGALCGRLSELSWGGLLRVSTRDDPDILRHSGGRSGAERAASDSETTQG